MSDAVLFDARDDGIAIITLNRPEARNALGKDIRTGLFAAWDRFERDPALRVAILTGSGDKAFCAGGDLKEMTELRLTVPPRDMFPVPGDNIEVTKPTIAAVNGVAFAGGWMIAQACDLCVASTRAQFAITEVKVGRSSPWAAPAARWTMSAPAAVRPAAAPLLPCLRRPRAARSAALRPPCPDRSRPRAVRWT